MNGTGRNADKDYAVIGIVDNDPLVSKALESMFTDRPTPLRVLWNVRSGEEALRLCADAAMRPDLVLTDLRMPGMDGKELTERLLAEHPGLAVLGMSAFQLGYTAEELRTAGMGAVIRKEAGTQEYVQLIGGLLDRPKLLEWREHTLAFERMMLTDTEINVLREYLKGRTTAATARVMHMSEGTVKTHMNNAYRKMNVHSRAEAIRICVREHLL
ncbi:response regulator transcription factor [Bifidobacterium amazonense]|uniref:Response regulator transcription factor n=1 Tax=Bifidobacterium amazonense TaxID=2809027 RepID=A0ABS9VU42_9BIFI|nr:response regulator transcription factor [Bifidobacterium amazonense]MCH9275604.1 response regulator transcription factor [Bifidobacterium amazonense]